ncbi:MAG: hypothetical protein WCS98_06880 [Bacillota bacterium]|jgi:phenylpyruvate tautomerase PptA (4-oxalocrotonate tautomerase family)|nr:hypothetical protein [Bacillota bacterium]MDD3298064.1 hypothetical protein [Bacillota bacterium]MDD3851705.1 hypothetical protein [Bacillota bacterium]MDD4708411.1 hypothetical protein [Bacillota bacterium]
MPLINIRTVQTGHRVDLDGFAGELSQKMGIDAKRINVVVDYLEETGFRFGQSTDKSIVHIWLSETNEKEFIQGLAKTVAELTEKHFCKEDGSTAVVCNLVREGYMFVNNKFK